MSPERLLYHARVISVAHAIGLLSDSSTHAQRGACVHVSTSAPSTNTWSVSMLAQTFGTWAKPSQRYRQELAPGAMLQRVVSLRCLKDSPSSPFGGPFPTEGTSPLAVGGFRASSTMKQHKVELTERLLYRAAVFVLQETPTSCLGYVTACVRMKIHIGLLLRESQSCVEVSPLLSASKFVRRTGRGG